LSDILSQDEIDTLLVVVEDISVPFMVVVNTTDRLEVIEYDEERINKHNIKVSEVERLSLKKEIAEIHGTHYDHIEIFLKKTDLAHSFKNRIETYRKVSENIDKIQEWLDSHPEHTL